MILRWWWHAILLTLLPAPVASQSDPAVVHVVRLIDGDTIQVCCIGWKREKVRYIGVDTPETHHPMRGVEPYGKEASEANRRLVDGKTVRGVAFAPEKVGWESLSGQVAILSR